MNFSPTNNSPILVLAPHTDDGELGCGASIVRWIEEGREIHYVAFSTADESVPVNFPKNQLEIEVREATHILGIQSDKLKIYPLQVRKLNFVRQEILEICIQLRDEIKPGLVLMPSTKDIHQDHITVTQEGIRAFKFSSILGYELMWNNLTFDTDAFVAVEQNHIDKKIRALAAYKTQAQKPYMDPNFISSLATVRGVQIGTKYAEAFEVIRWIL